MVRSNTEQLTFSAGEVSPLLHGRTDYQRVQAGMRQCRGFIPLRQGGFTRAPGTRWRGATRGHAEGRLIAFTFAADDSVVLEFTALKMRVWRYGELVMSGGSPYEIDTPYDLSAIRRLRWAQSADVIYMVDGARPAQRLSRLALDNWTIGPVTFRRGPFKVENDDEDVVITASSPVSGVVTLTATGGAPFKAGHVGSLWQLRVVDDAEIPTWTGNTGGNSAGDMMRYDGRIYQNLDGANTGVNPPIHRSGTVLVAKDGPRWRYVSDDIGVVRIDAVASGTSATATVMKRLAPGVISSGTWRWSEAAWSDVSGWPSSIAIHDQRLVLAATSTDPRTLWFSTAGALRDFEPGVEADSSFAYSIAGTGSVNRVLWLQSGARGLHIGALGDEYSSRSTTSGDAIGPTNFAVQLDSTIGSHDAQPIAPDGRPIFISRDRGRVFELRYAFDEDATRSTELSLPAEHLGAARFEEIVWQSAPLRLAWLRRGDGELCVLVHDPVEDVLGWAVYPLAGGAVESLCVSGSQDGLIDIVTLVVRREVAGAVRRFVEQISVFHGVLTGAQDVAVANHLFAARVKDGVGSPFTVIDGLEYLEGQTVHVWSDRGDLGAHVVQAGAVTLAEPVGRARVGLFDETHIAETLGVAAPTREGGGLGRQRRVKAMGLRWHRTSAAEARVVEREFARPDIEGAWRDATAMPVPRDLVQGWDGVVNVPMPGGHAPEITIQLRPRGGAPMTLLAAMPVVETAGG